MSSSLVPKLSSFGPSESEDVAPKAGVSGAKIASGPEESDGYDAISAPVLITEIVSSSRELEAEAANPGRVQDSRNVELYLDLPLPTANSIRLLRKQETASLYGGNANK